MTVLLINGKIIPIILATSPAMILFFEFVVLDSIYYLSSISIFLATSAFFKWQPLIFLGYKQH